MKTLLHWVASILAIVVAAYILPGITITGIVPLLVLSIVLGAINTFVRPVLVLLTLPLSVATLGLFTLILNTLLIMLAGAIVPGVIIAGFWWALLFGIVLSITSSFLKKLQD